MRNDRTLILYCVSSVDRGGDETPKYERKSNGGCASRGKILSEQRFIITKQKTKWMKKNARFFFFFFFSWQS